MKTSNGILQLMAECTTLSSLKILISSIDFPRGFQLWYVQMQPLSLSLILPHKNTTFGISAGSRRFWCTSGVCVHVHSQTQKKQQLLSSSSLSNCLNLISSNMLTRLTEAVSCVKPYVSTLSL